MVVTFMRVYAINVEGKGFVSYKPYEFTNCLGDAKLYHTLGRAKAKAHGLAIHYNIRIHAIGLSPMGVVYDKKRISFS